MSDTVNTCQCPACGQANDCAIAQSADATERPCWCFLIAVDHKAFATIASLSDGARGAACLCKRCLGGDGGATGTQCCEISC